MTSATPDVIVATRFLQATMDARQVIAMLPHLTAEQQEWVKNNYLVQMAVACDKAEAICREHSIQIAPRSFTGLFSFVTGDNPHAHGRRRGVMERVRAFWDGMQTSMFAELQRPAAILSPLPAMPRSAVPGVAFSGIVHFQDFRDNSRPRMTIVSAELLSVAPEFLLTKLSDWMGQKNWHQTGVTIGPLLEEEADLLQAVLLNVSTPSASTAARVYREISPTLQAGEMVVRYHLEVNKL